MYFSFVLCPLKEERIKEETNENQGIDRERHRNRRKKEMLLKCWESQGREGERERHVGAHGDTKEIKNQTGIHTKCIRKRYT